MKQKFGQKCKALRARVQNKLKNTSGESLIETLVAILIASFASVMLANGTSTASAMNMEARNEDKAFRESLMVVESQDYTVANTETGKQVKLVLKAADGSNVMTENIGVTYYKSGKLKTYSRTF